MKEQNQIMPLWSGEKKHTYSEIKEFYQKISVLPQEILDQIIFYGGTIIYVAAQYDQVDRTFGDLDILVPTDKMSLVREHLEKIGDLVIQYDGKKTADEYKIISSDGIQDFGFKGVLFGIKISVHPIGVTDDGQILTKWIKINNGEIELIANCTMLLDSNIEELLTKIKFENKDLTIIKPEIILGWKKRRMESHDEQDIKFMLDNKQILKIDEKNIDMFISKMPNYDVSKAYKITDDGIQELGKGTYEDF